MYSKDIADVSGSRTSFLSTDPGLGSLPTSPVIPLSFFSICNSHNLSEIKNA